MGQENIQIEPNPEWSNAVSHGYLECKIKRFFAAGCLGKKLAFQTEVCDFFENYTFKCSFFHWVNKLFKSNQTQIETFHLHLN